MVARPTAVPDSEWLTVTEAAERLRRDLPWLDLNKARARVSAEAGRGKFKTNGRQGKARRIHRDSFSTWRLAQRDRDLDKEGESELSETSAR